ncbi:MAG TPA: hypothetical protein VGX78_11340 [Pirellulales bacterium]|nr:hypothetical protein [Pirellulales bacterium]
MEFHPLADVFPLMSPRELDELAADIAAYGQREPIYLYEGMILDGRNRYNACLKAGLKPCVRPWDGEGDPVAFVVSMNLHRRHLDDSQRALAAGKLARLKQGYRPHQGGSSIDETLENTADPHRPIGRCADRGGDVTTPQAAELLNVGERSVRRAREVLEYGDETLVAAVEAGDVSVTDAAKIVAKPKSVQQAAVDRVKAGEAKTLAAAAKRIERGATPPEATVQEELSDVADELGNRVPKRYLAIFVTRADFAATIRKFDEARRAVEELAETAAGHYLRKELANLTGKFKEIKFILTRTAPYAFARGKPTEPKWVTEIGWRSLSDEERGQ